MSTRIARASCVLLVVVCALLSSANANLWKYLLNPRLSQAPTFASSAFHDVSSKTGLGSVNGSIGCYGDFNSDRYTDVFVISEDKSSVTVMLWDTEKWKFKAGPVVTTNLTIQHIAATDFNHDGRLDLLIQGTAPGVTNGDLSLCWYKGDYKQLTLVASLPESQVPVTIVDVNNDLLPDLLGQRGLKRYVWKNGKDSSGETTFTLEEATGFNPQKPLSLVHSNAFVDLNGDCLADLVLTTPTTPVDETPSYEFFINNGDGYSPISVVQSTPTGAGLLTFADFDGDGTIDIMFPVCAGTDCAEENSIRIIYNVQLRICQSIFDTNCRKETEQCNGDANWKLADFKAASSPDVVIVNAGAFKGSHLAKNHNVLRAYAGDYNLDGYPDILVPVVSQGSVTMAIFKSVPCSTSVGCTADASKKGRRTFVLASPSETSQVGASHATAASFFDLDEDGTVDILISALDETGRPHLRALFNNINNDAYFFKTLGLNGVCTQFCKEGTFLPDPLPYGVNQFGATLKFSISDLKGVKHSTAIAQLSQTAYGPLQTPYTITGLGRISNYVEYTYLGVPYKSKEPHFYYWSGLIPNSQIVAIPYPPDDPASWRPALYINPSGVTLWIIIAIIVWLLVIGAIVGFFTWREKKQDEKEKKEREHLFSFRAL